MTGIVIDITGDPTFEAPVSLGRPGKEPAIVTFTFKHMTREQLSDWAARSQAKDADTAALLEEIVDGWGPEIAQAYSPDALRTLLKNYHTASIDIADGYRKALLEARRKN